MVSKAFKHLATLVPCLLLSTSSPPLSFLLLCLIHSVTRHVASPTLYRPNCRAEKMGSTAVTSPPVRHVASLRERNTPKGISIGAPTGYVRCGRVSVSFFPFILAGMRRPARQCLSACHRFSSTDSLIPPNGLSYYYLSLVFYTLAPLARYNAPLAGYNKNYIILCNFYCTPPEAPV